MLLDSIQLNELGVGHRPLHVIPRVGLSRSADHVLTGPLVDLELALPGLGRRGHLELFVRDLLLDLEVGLGLLEVEVVHHDRARADLPL